MTEGVRSENGSRADDLCTDECAESRDELSVVTETGVAVIFVHSWVARLTL